MVYAGTKAEIEQRRRAFLRKWRLKCKAVADSLEEAGGSAVHLHPPRPVAVEIRPNDQRHRAAARGVPTPDQDPGRAARRRDGADAVLGPDGVRPDRDAKGRRMGDPFSASRS